MAARLHTADDGRGQWSSQGWFDCPWTIFSPSGWLQCSTGALWWGGGCPHTVTAFLPCSSTLNFYSPGWMATTKWSEAPTLLQVRHYLTYPQIHHSDNPVVENMYSNMPVLSLEPHTLSDDVNNAGPPGIWWETQTYLPGHTEASLTYLSHETLSCVDIGCQVSCQENLIQHLNFLFAGRGEKATVLELSGKWWTWIL